MSNITVIEPEIVKIGSFADRIEATYAQQVGRIYNANEEDRKHSDENWQRADKDMKKVGRVPRVVWMLWEQLGITSDPQELLAALERNKECKTTDKQLI